MPELSRTGDVFVLHLGTGENRLHPDWLTDVEAALDTVAATPVPRALVTTAGGKIYSNGLDLEWIGQNPDGWGDYMARVYRLLARLLTFPVPTVAAIQGHAFAAGAMFALAQDFRVMRADRGFFCLPEVDIRIPFTPGMADLIRIRLAPQVAHEAMTTGRRYGGTEALAAGIVDAVADEDSVLAAAVERAAQLAGKDGPTLGAIKHSMYRSVTAALCTPVAADAASGS